jgi:hypothetical protein
MTDMPAAVYRLLPGMGEFRTLRLDETSHARLIRWQRTGSAETPPERVSVVWDGPPQLRPAEFASGLIGARLLSRRIADLMRADLLTAGAFIPVSSDDSGEGEYLFYLAEPVVGCVDTGRSSKPQRTSGQIKKTVFRPEALPVELAAFRIPEYPVAIYWNGWAADRQAGLLGDDIEARLVWSADRSATPHPADPWGF